MLRKHIGYTYRSYRLIALLSLETSFLLQILETVPARYNHNVLAIQLILLYRHILS